MTIESTGSNKLPEIDVDRDEFRKEIGRRLRAARSAKGLSYPKLAEQLEGITVGRLGDYEQGRREPSLWVLWRLTVALEIDLHQLLENLPE